MSEPIPLVDLKAAHADVADDVARGWAEILAKTAFILSPHVDEFEKSFAAFSERKHCIGVANGTDAIELALRASSVKAGDEVIVPAMTFAATALAVMRLGAKPVLVDVDRESLLLDVAGADRVVTKKTKAIVPVDLYGQKAPFTPIIAFARKHNLVVVEDAAQSQGARDDVGAIGAGISAAATSFYPGKNLGAYGDAGAVVTDDDDVAARLRSLRDYGRVSRYDHREVGFNSRLDPLQAVVLSAKLKHLSSWNKRRRVLAKRYDALLQGLPVRPIQSRANVEHVFHLYVICLDGSPHKRDEVLAGLNRRGIGAAIHYPIPLHLQGSFSSWGYKRGSFPVSESAAESMLSLPIYPHLSDAQQDRVLGALRDALKESGLV